jgi:hypothetical protein
MRLMGTRRAVGTIAVFALIGPVAFVDGASGTSARAAAVISSLSVGGSPAKPVFTITGTGLTVPAPNPRTSPSGQQLCPLKISGNAGFDYGTQFYLIDWDAQPNGTNSQLYAAGRYRPNLNELDCIGLVVLAHTPTKVSFTFGHAYVQYRSKYRTLGNQDVIEVVLNGAALATVVHFR